MEYLHSIDENVKTVAVLFSLLILGLPFVCFLCFGIWAFWNLLTSWLRTPQSEADFDDADTAFCDPLHVICAPKTKEGPHDATESD